MWTLHSFCTHTTEVVEELEAQLGEDWRVGNPYQVIHAGEKSRDERPKTQIFAMNHGNIV